jgi:hypothetical protein
MTTIQDTVYPPRRPEAPTQPAPAAARVSPAPRPMAAVEIIRACREAAVLDLAETLIADGNLTSEVVTARISAELQARAEVIKTHAAIRTLCNRADAPDLADGYIKGQFSFDDVKYHMWILTAKMDDIEIDTFLAPDAGTTKAGAGISTSGIFAKRNQPAAAVGVRS